MYPDLATAKWTPGKTGLAHWLEYGALAGRKIGVSPSGTVGYWDDAGYLSVNPDVAKDGQSAWPHYSKIGWKQARTICVKDTRV